MVRKLTLEECQQFAITKGGQCLDTEYINSKTLMQWRCYEGHTWRTKFNSIKASGSWCPHCAGTAKLTLEECQQTAIAKGGECLSTEYINCNTSMQWKCSTGHTWNSCYGSMKSWNTWCPYCAHNLKKDLAECQQFAIDKGGECLSTEYINCNTPMQWKCSIGHTWYVKFSSVKGSNSWCPSCSIINSRLTLKECQQAAIAKGGECLSTEYIDTLTPMQWKCNKEHVWTTNFCYIKYSNSWCLICANNNRRLSIEECQQFAIDKGGQCLSEEYINLFTKMKWKCDKGHEWEAIYSSLKNSNTWCPICSSGRSEKSCRKIFEKYCNAKFPNVRPTFLEGLELDGYNMELKVAFEYQGKQHYHYMYFFHRGDYNKFLKQKERDMRKYKLCKKYHIHLVVIPYHFSYMAESALETFIIENLVKNDFNKLHLSN